MVPFAQKKLVSDNSALLSYTLQKLFSIDIELLCRHMSPTQDNSNVYNASRRDGGEEVGIHPYCTQKHVFN